MYNFKINVIGGQKYGKNDLTAKKKTKIKSTWF